MPIMTPEKKFEVQYRNRSGDMTTKKTTATGTDNTAVKKYYESLGYQVIAVIYKGLTGKSIEK
ncbi:hypothetical protein BST55_22560 [Vibrio vulnificus]|uniref:hypothetical protein n=1 Tax=Vibrio TaxID=662 RepID=UPI000BA0D642|nr:MULTISPECIES: hypothetical protein [Vibrio]EGR8992317.1 hypothetical protein [Vibrio vulnificus]MCS0218507.1 hypothetical protein [Vibrio alginolyticus]MCU8566772.1 hypothetical protein [Vibrio vulnificus]NOI46037.1 hypothetical protein [Vibrio alginolyticus]OZS51060.1 hypothetical protein BST51_22355 [Vibrio vulnificus]